MLKQKQDNDKDLWATKWNKVYLVFIACKIFAFNNKFPTGLSRIFPSWKMNCPLRTVAITFPNKIFPWYGVNCKIKYVWRLVKSVEIFIIRFPFFKSISHLHLLCFYGKYYLSRSREIRDFLMIYPRRLFSWNIMCTTELTLIVSSGFQITKSASIPSLRLPLLSSRPHNFAGWLLNSFEMS